jgi:hypothetical protein
MSWSAVASLIGQLRMGILVVPIRQILMTKEREDIPLSSGNKHVRFNKAIGSHFSFIIDNPMSSGLVVSKVIRNDIVRVTPYSLKLDKGNPIMETEVLPPFVVDDEHPAPINPFSQDGFNMGTSIGLNVTVMYGATSNEMCQYIIVVDKMTGKRVRVNIKLD